MLHKAAMIALLTQPLVACNDDNDDEIRDLREQLTELQQLLDSTETSSAETVTALQDEITSLRAQLATMDGASDAETAALQAQIAELQTELDALTAEAPVLGAIATTGANLLAKDNADNIWKYALFPDMQGRDDDDYSIRLEHTNPDGSVVTNEALTRSGSYYVGVDVNRDGIWDGSSHQIDVTDPLNPTFVLDENGYAIAVDSAERKDTVGDWKTLPYPHAEPIIDKIIEEGVDVVFFLGDITEHRSEHEYVQFRDYIMQPLQEAGVEIVPDSW